MGLFARRGLRLSDSLSELLGGSRPRRFTHVANRDLLLFPAETPRAASLEVRKSKTSVWPGSNQTGDTEMSHFGSTDLLKVLVIERGVTIVCTHPAEQCADAAPFAELPSRVCLKIGFFFLKTKITFKTRERS